MLHSFHYYYACYYALLCLLHQQQQAASVTVIIDGATTNEWATRDEYQRLMESSRAPSAPGATGSLRSLASGLLVGANANANTNGAGANLDNDDRAAPMMVPGQQAAAMFAEDGGAEQRRLLAATLELGAAEQEAAAANLQTMEELDLALDRLDLIEQQQRQRLGRLKTLERLASHGLDVGPNQLTMQMQPTAPVAGLVTGGLRHTKQQAGVVIGGIGGGARSISDLVPLGDDDLEDPLRRLKERGSSPQKYCGHKLIDVLELVCQGQFYGGDSEPEIVNPTIKSKRFIEFDPNRQQQQQDFADELLANEGQQLAEVTRRRKLRTLESRPDAAMDHMGSGAGKSFGRGGGNTRDYDDDDDGTNKNHHLQQQQQQQPTQQQQQQQQQEYLSSPSQQHATTNIDNNNNANDDNTTTTTTNNNNNNKQHRQNLIKDNYNINLNQNVRNKHSKMALYRRIRGANTDCCLRSCYLEELKPYCKKAP